MKHLYAFFLAFLLLAQQGTSAQTTASASAVDSATTEADAVCISMLTCAPHDEIYSLYGHSSLRVEDTHRGMDVAVNYGLFSFEKPFFMLRFVFGLTDYEMGIFPFEVFSREYQYYGSSVTQQEFNLTADEKIRILKAIDTNSQSENRVYRYNFFYDNCTTRARDIVTDNIDGQVVYPDTAADGMTMRQMLHEMNHDSPWASLGNDLLLGIGADRPLHEADTRALPLLAMRALSKAYIINKDGTRRPLIKQTTTPVAARVQTTKAGFPLSPLHCSALLLILFTALTAAEWKMKKYFWWIDGTLFAVIGIGGIILSCMLFSEHPTVKANIQILMMNPLPLIFGWKAVRSRMKERPHWLWTAGVLMICLLLICNSFGIQWLDPSVRVASLVCLLRYTMGMAINIRKKQAAAAKS